MKIAHISDIHLDSQRNPNCLAEIEELIQRVFDKGYDHLVITGDVVDVANYDDLWALREIFKRNGALHWERVTIIPGNHDVFGKYEFTSNGVGATASRALQLTGLNFAKKLHEFCDIFRETITEEPEITTYFPFVKVLSGGKNGVALVSFFERARMVGAPQSRRLSRLHTCRTTPRGDPKRSLGRIERAIQHRAVSSRLPNFSSRKPPPTPRSSGQWNSSSANRSSTR